MGIVYAARDERLERIVALKTMSSMRDESARLRFWREARAAASVNHPNVCQIYEIGEDSGQLFIAMELLEGKPLSEHLRQGPMSVAETITVGRGMLAALAALHARGVIHRDLKPSNVFLTPHGVKLLDFGLARVAPGPAVADGMDLTRVGTVLGTPRYMAPEQALGQAVDSRADLFAAGAILFEMLAGRPAFTGRTVVETVHAAVYENPPALTGPPAVAAVDRVIRRALAKKPEDRSASAEAMAEELRAIRAADAGQTAALAQAMTRLVVLPFRVLRADPETDFLAFSLPDAITTSLSNISTLVVRTSATAARFASETPDLKAVAAEADVDRVVTGTLLRSGDELRVAAQLVEAPGGTLIASHTVQAPLGDLFRLQDDIARRVADALALPLGGGPPSPFPEGTPNARAYELYLRGNECARNYEGVVRARDLYQRCVELDSRFAPAWARLGRCHRVIGKYLEASGDADARAEEALKRALELNPRLSVAHKFYANLEGDLGRAEQAMVRLLGEAARHGNDPELFAGLVHACRYCGLYEESMAAHAEARRLDPNIGTGVAQTYLLSGNTDWLDGDPSPTEWDPGADAGIRVISLGLAGRRDEAKLVLDRMRYAPGVPLFQTWVKHLNAWLGRRVDEMFDDLTELTALGIYSDPEAVFQEGWLLCDVGEYDRGLPYLERGVGKGYFAAKTLAMRSQFDALRDRPEFQSLLADATAGRERALLAFRNAGGDRLLVR